MLKWTAISKLSPDVKLHVMKSLASFSKFIGKYDDWLEIIRKYQLKWSNGNNKNKVFKAIFQNEGNTYTSMVGWIRLVISVLPHNYQNVILFNTLTGLRPYEAQKTIWLTKTKESDYVDKDRWTIKHYQHPESFLRQT